MAQLDRDAPVYPIGIVQKLTGLTGRQIRYYEKAGLLTPTRTPGNQRLYSPNQVDLLLDIKELLAQGYNVEGVKTRLAERYGSLGRRRAGRVEVPVPLAAPAPDAPPAAVETAPERISSEEHLRLIQAMRSGRPLSSLYPVNNQAELVRKLQETRSDDSS
ncbi:MerR family transcriptional regulator [Limnochorda pilosa]|uniref:MerR family transcriptional regulator n=1 Tax=Limnochorda pilosa TaxID=1555112 RepID=A0A0K2SJ44_LIMPI|nr:MerR family transcriptional regulator [Limnochorda pilosa]BAS27123.1 MerR family transcriptional regulator [Limnochorda pilosa]